MRKLLLVLVAIMAFAFLSPTDFGETAGTAYGLEMASLIDCADATDVTQAECEALLDLFYSTDGPNWTDNTNWDDSTEVCTWYGVTCIDNMVTALDLGGLGLTGDIPDSFNDLTNLITFEAYNNDIDSLPADCSSLTNLSQIYLSNNNLTDMSCVIDMTGLTHLDMSSNVILVIPENIDDLSELTVLDLTSNGIGVVPADLTNLTNLTRLALWFNEISSLPNTFDDLINLEELNLSGNPLNSLPSSIGSLAQLEVLRISDLDINSIPEEYSNLVNLTELWIHYNSSLAAIPDEVYDMTSLEYLSYRYYTPSAWPEELSAMTNLETLILHGLTSVSASITNLVNLTSLAMYNADFDSLPTEMGSMGIESLQIYDSEMTALPESFINLPLTSLAVNNNNLCEESMSIDLVAFIDDLDPDWREHNICGGFPDPDPVPEDDEDDEQFYSNLDLSVNILGPDRFSITSNILHAEEGDGVALFLASQENDELFSPYDSETDTFEDCGEMDLEECAALYSFSIDEAEIISTTGLEGNLLDSSVDYPNIFYIYDVTNEKSGLIKIAPTFIRVTDSDYSFETNLDEINLLGTNYIQFSDYGLSQNWVDDSAEIIFGYDRILIDSVEVNEVDDTGYFNAAIDFSQYEIPDGVELSLLVRDVISRPFSTRFSPVSELFVLGCMYSEEYGCDEENEEIGEYVENNGNPYYRVSTTTDGYGFHAGEFSRIEIGREATDGISFLARFNGLENLTTYDESETYFVQPTNKGDIDFEINGASLLIASGDSNIAIATYVEPGNLPAGLVNNVWYRFNVPKSEFNYFTSAGLETDEFDWDELTGHAFVNSYENELTFDFKDVIFNYIGEGLGVVSLNVSTTSTVPEEENEDEPSEDLDTAPQSTGSVSTPSPTSQNPPKINQNPDPISQPNGLHESAPNQNESPSSEETNYPTENEADDNSEEDITENIETEEDAVPNSYDDDDISEIIDYLYEQSLDSGEATYSPPEYGSPFKTFADGFRMNLSPSFYDTDRDGCSDRVELQMTATNLFGGGNFAIGDCDLAYVWGESQEKMQEVILSGEDYISLNLSKNPADNVFASASNVVFSGGVFTAAASDKNVTINFSVKDLSSSIKYDLGNVKSAYTPFKGGEGYQALFSYLNEFSFPDGAYVLTASTDTATTQRNFTIDSGIPESDMKVHEFSGFKLNPFSNESSIKKVKFKVDENGDTYVYGETSFNNLVVASWNSVLLTSVAMADSASGKFYIEPRQKLEPGDHTLILYAKNIDDPTLASKPMKIEFKILTKNEQFMQIVIYISLGIIALCIAIWTTTILVSRRRNKLLKTQGRITVEGNGDKVFLKLPEDKGSRII